MRGRPQTYGKATRNVSKFIPKLIGNRGYLAEIKR
jgi:hypothetical protein